MCGGTGCNCMFVPSKYWFRSSGTSLSIMCSFVVNPRFLNFQGVFYPVQYQGYSYIFEWYYEDVVCVIVLGHQYVVVTSVWLNCKFTSKVRIYFSVGSNIWRVDYFVFLLYWFI